MSELVKRERQDMANGSEMTRSGESYSPRIDIFETDDEMMLYADVPGVTADGVELKYEMGELTLHAHVAPRNDGVHYTHHEYGVGDFYRSFKIGPAVDASKINAEINSGVLKVHLPKSDAVRSRRIEVKAS